jgi:hypothetical protein
MTESIIITEVEPGRFITRVLPAENGSREFIGDKLEFIGIEDSLIKVKKNGDVVCLNAHQAMFGWAHYFDEDEIPTYMGECNDHPRRSE